MSRFFEGIAAYVRDRFDATDWEEDEEGDRTVAFHLADDDGQAWDCAVLVDDEDERLVFYSTMLDAVPKDRLVAVMELVTRANFGLPVGNFELDLDDGELCFPGDNSWSTATTSGLSASTRPRSSSSLPLPRNVRGSGASRCCTMVPAVATPAVRSSSASSASSMSSPGRPAIWRPRGRSPGPKPALTVSAGMPVKL